MVSALALGIALFCIGACQTRAPVASSDSNANPLPQTTAREDSVYDSLPGVKAQALSTAPGMQYTNNVANQANPVVAALQALNDCEQARAARSTPSSPCELRRKGDVIIHSTAELTAGFAAERPALLWRLSGPAANDANVYIAGSIHVLKPTMQAPPSYSQALRASENLVFEIDDAKLTATQMQALVTQYGQLPEGQTLAGLMTPEDYQRLVTYTDSLGLPEEMLNTMKPAMLLLQLGALEYVSLGYLPEHGVESVFRKSFLARENRREILALETVEQQLAAATALPLELQSELLLETLDEIQQVPLDVSDLVQAWLAGDAGRLDTLFNDTTDASPAAQNWMDDLLNKRNIGMAAGVAELLASDGTYLVLVGAAHLVGDNSVIALLQEQGVTATRLQQNSLDAAHGQANTQGQAKPHGQSK